MYKVVAIFCIIPLLLLFSCNTQKGRVLSKEEMENVLYDMQLSHALYSDYNMKLNRPEQKDSVINDILYRHNITQADLDTSLIWYSDNINEYKKINEVVALRLKGERDVLKSRITKREEQRKYTVMPPSYTLDYTTPVFTFDIDSLKLKDIDLPSFAWRFDVLGVAPKDSVEATIFFAYADSTVHANLTIDKDKSYVFTKPELPDSLLKSISGYARIVNARFDGNVLLHNMHYISSDTTKNEQPATEVDLALEPEPASDIQL